MATKKTQKLLPRVTYAPQDGGWQRGGGDYEYTNRANSYNANPDYAQQYGGNQGSGGTPPLLSPPQDDPPQPHSLFGDMANASKQFGPVLNNMAAGAYDWLNDTGNYLFSGMPPKTAFPEDWQQKVARPVNLAYGQTPPGWSPGIGAGVGAGGGPVQYNPLGDAWQGIQDWLAQTFGGQPQEVVGRTPPGWSPGVPSGAVGSDPVGRTPPGWTPGVPSGNIGGGSKTMLEATGKTPPGWVPTVGAGAPADMQTQAARLQDAMNKNQDLTQKANAAGNDKEMQRLQAEWERIAPKAAKYGITADRLINSYMQPGNDAAEPTLDRALGRAIADDTWANAASIAFGRSPNDVEWREHWTAMNKGGRDPLEGHPAAIQAIQAKMKEIESENQNEAYGQYQNWLANQ